MRRRTRREFRDYPGESPVFMGKNMDILSGGVKGVMAETRIRTWLF